MQIINMLQLIQCAYRQYLIKYYKQVVQKSRYIRYYALHLDTYFSLSAFSCDPVCLDVGMTGSV